MYYFATIQEDAPVGTALVIDGLLAKDVDTNENSQLTFSLQATGNFGLAFSLNGTTVVVSTATQLDRETLSSYDLTITVSCPR